MSPEPNLSAFYVTTVNWEKHPEGLYDTFRLAYKMLLTEHADDSFPPHISIHHINRFPEGQLVAVEKRGDEEFVVGAAMTMRTNHPPTPGEHHTWLDFIGGVTIENHEPDGEWLYGIESCVRPDYQGYGIGTMLYKARFEMVQRLNLRGWYAGGRLREIFEILGRIAGIRPPRFKVSPGAIMPFARLSEWVADHLTGRAPLVAADAVRMARKRMFFDAGKAVRELGMPQSPVEDALAGAVAWFRANGYAPKH